jgi:hypothetical protein
VVNDGSRRGGHARDLADWDACVDLSTRNVHLAKVTRGRAPRPRR